MRPTTTGRRIQAGVTLIELLVAMLILGLVMSLVSQAVFQVGKVVRLAHAASEQLTSHWGQGWSVSTTIGSLVAPAEAVGPPLVGDSSSLETFTTAPPVGQTEGVTRLSLRLRPSTQDAGWTEMWARVGADPSRGAESVVARFRATAEWRFRTQQGEWVQAWPPFGQPPSPNGPALPAAVAVNDSKSGQVLIVYPVHAPGFRQIAGGNALFGER